MAAALPAISAGASVIGGLFGKSSANKVQPPPNFYAPYASQAAEAAFSGIQNMPGADWSTTAIPGATNIYNAAMNNPGQGAATAGANSAMGMGQQGAGTMYGYGQGMSGYGANLLPYAQQIINMGLDPQQQMYDRTLHNVTEQTRAGLAARGLGMTPYGAGVENKALSDFNIDWNNTALNRAATGAQAGGQLAGRGGDFITQGQALAGQAPGAYYTASMYPYATYSGMNADQLKALTGATGVVQGAQNLAATPIEAYLRMVQGGQTAANANATFGLNQAKMGFDQNQTLGSNLGQGLQGLGKADWSWMKNMGTA